MFVKIQKSNAITSIIPLLSFSITMHVSDWSQDLRNIMTSIEDLVDFPANSNHTGILSGSMKWSWQKRKQLNVKRNVYDKKPLEVKYLMQFIYGNFTCLDLVWTRLDSYLLPTSEFVRNHLSVVTLNQDHAKTFFCIIHEMCLSSRRFT
jgi:hypothetical protein